MARVDFAGSDPSEHVRAQIERQARKLPRDWSVSLRKSPQPEELGSMYVTVEGKKADYRAKFDDGRFDLVTSFLESLARNVGRA